MPSAAAPAAPVPSKLRRVSLRREPICAPEASTRGLRHRRSRGASAAAPLRLRSLLGLAVDLDVDALVVEADQVPDRLHLPLRLGIAPGHRVLAGDVEVGGLALVGASGAVIRRLELGPDVLAPEVPARWKAGLEQHDRP